MWMWPVSAEYTLENQRQRWSEEATLFVQLSAPQVWLSLELYESKCILPSGQGILWRHTLLSEQFQILPPSMLAWIRYCFMSTHLHIIIYCIVAIPNDDLFVDGEIHIAVRTAASICILKGLLHVFGAVSTCIVSVPEVFEHYSGNKSTCKCWPQRIWWSLSSSTAKQMYVRIVSGMRIWGKCSIGIHKLKEFEFESVFLNKPIV